MTDHDRLITIEGKVDALLENQAKSDIALSKFASRIAIQYTALEERVRENEREQTRCSADNMHLKDDIQELQRKSNIWDSILGIGTVVGTIIGALLGGKST